MDVNPAEEMVDRPPSPQEDDRDSAHHFPHNDVDLEEPPLALLIEHTVIAILSRVGSFQDLKSCRLVNSTWKRSSTRALRSRPGGWIYFSDRRRKYADMKTLISMLETSSREFPWNKFHVETGFHHPDPDWPHEKQVVVEIFFRAVAPFLKELELTDGSRTGGERLFPSAPPPTGIQFPVLEKINVNLGRVNGIRHGDGTYYAEPIHSRILESNLHFVRVILANAPRLKEVLSGECHRSSDGSGLASLDHLAKPLPKLTVYNSSLLVETFTLLANVEAGHRLQLREFDFTYCPYRNSISPDVISESVSHFLALQSESLEVLRLDVAARLPLPRLPRLRKLNSNCRLTVEHSYPALQELILVSFATFNFVAIVQPMEALTTLQLPLPGDLPLAFFQSLAHAMPNIRKLSVTLVGEHDEQYILNLDNMAPLENVEELSVQRGQGDRMLTGFSDEELAVWKEYSPEELKTRSQTLKDPPQILQKLRKLTIVTCWNWDQESYMSDLSWVMLLKLTKLTCLDLSSPYGMSEQYTMSAQVLAQMRSKFEVLVRRYTLK